MSELQLNEIEARLKAASPGAWKTGLPPAGSVPKSGVMGCVKLWCDGRRVPENTELVAHAPADIGALIDEVRRLQALNKLYSTAIPDDD